MRIFECIKGRGLDIDQRILVYRLVVQLDVVLELDGSAISYQKDTTVGGIGKDVGEIVGEVWRCGCLVECLRRETC